MKEETKTMILSIWVIACVFAWCFIPCVWAITDKLNGTNHIIEGFIFAGITGITLAGMLWFAIRDAKKQDKEA
jgi:hypothetical protein